MKSTRRLLSLILCLLMCLTVFPASAFAANIMASGQVASNVEFVLYTDGKLVLSGSGTVPPMEQWTFSTSTLPNSFDKANDDVNATRSATVTLVIESGITSIAADVFHDCPNLKSVTFPSSLLSIGNNAFQNCSSLASVTIPSNVVNLGDGAFQGCINLTSVKLSAGVNFLQDNTFRDCVKLAAITIPANITGIGANAFANCSSLKTVSFEGNLIPGMIDSVAFTGVTATVNYPVDNDSWNTQITAEAGYPDFGGRLTWQAKAESSASDEWVQKNGEWYFYMNGKMLTDTWKAYAGKWFYFDKNGRLLRSGHTLVNGDYYFLDPTTGERLSGWQTDPTDGTGRFYGEDGKWQPAYSGVNDTGLNMMVNGWQTAAGNRFYIKNQQKVTGWLKDGKYWYYLDPTTGAMVRGWLTEGGKTYYLRPDNLDGHPDGSMVAGRTVLIGGTYYTFDDSGALQGGKMDENPLGLATGWRNEGNATNPLWRFYRSTGAKATGWELVNNGWYYFDKNGNLQTGWKQIDGVWYYLMPGGTPPARGRMVTGFNTINITKEGINTSKTYYFYSNGALGGTGWIKDGNKWFYLREDGVVAIGWFRDGNKWYYLSDGSDSGYRYGEMVTGTFTTTLTSADSPAAGTHNFKANGEWVGTGTPSTAGSWKKQGSKWYYYDVHNNKVTGWQNIGNKWYYFDPSDANAMVTGWKKIGSDTFFFNSNGAMLAGWQQISGNWYYLNPTKDENYGKLMTGWNKIKGEWYFMDKTSGAVQSGWKEVVAGESDGWAPGWYYLNPTHDGNFGVMQHGGWKQIGSKWYYFHNTHDSAWGRLEQDYWLVENGKAYYFKKSSNPAESWMAEGWVTWGGKKYYFNPGSGEALGGWQKIKDKWYYFHNVHDGNFGYMYTSTVVDGYTIDANGVSNRK